MFGLFTCLFISLLLCVGTLRKPAIALAAVLCLYGLKQWGQNASSFLASDRTAMNFVVAVIVIAGILRDWRKNLSSGSIPLTWWLGLILYIYAFITLSWSPNISAALEQWSLQIPYVLMIAITAPLLIKTIDDARLAVEWTLFVAGAICALAMVFGKWGLRGLLVSGDFLRSETNPLAIASLGGTACVIAMVSIMVPMSWLKRVPRIVIALLGIAVILRSGSRGQLAAVVVATLVGMPIAAKKRNFGAWFMMAITIAIIAQAGWWIWDQLGVNSARWSGERSGDDAAGRFMMATTLLSAAVADPLKLIAGLSNSSAFYYVGFYPHIAPLEVLAEEGIFGFALYLGIVLLTIRNVIKLDSSIRSRQDYASNYVVATLAALFIFEWTLTFKQGTLLSSVYAIAYAAILGSLSRQYATRSEEPVISRDNQLAGDTLVLPNLMR